MIGALLGNRYEILEKIGGGGMAEVYKAKCRLLNRYVAVKILKAELMEDNDFIDRFQAEAQSVASLSHANIVSIYDVGQENDLYYIVMEYINGITLKSKIIKEKKISWSEALDISMQISFALKHAHANRIIHRDIKPHNILISSEGIIKVTDFGIARVVSSNTVTYGGNTIGSVHYSSPEQSKGSITDEKSDIYSLGIVLYEMVTGNVPFKGDSHVSVAMKQIEDNPVPPREKNKEIPKALNAIIMKCLEKDPNDRYQSIKHVIDDLGKCYNNPNVDFVEKVNEDDFPTQKIPPLGRKNGSDDTMAVKRNKNKKSKREDKIAVIAAIITSIVIIGIISYFAIGFINDFFGTSQVSQEEKVPELIGMDINKALEMYKDTQFSILEVDREYSDEFDKDTIISQEPESGILVKMPKNIEVTVCKGVKMVEVPDLLNIDYRQAEIELENIDLRYTLKYEYSDTVPTGYISKQSPEAFNEVKEGSLVTLYVSNGPDIKEVKVPVLKGMTLKKAEEEIENLGLVVGEVERVESEEPFDTVISQSIQPGTKIEEGSTIDLFVSNFKPVKNERYIKINLPQNKQEVKVTLVYHDGSAKMVVYEERHKTSEKTLTIPVSGKGQAFVQVYIDDKLVGEDVIDFGGDDQ